MKGEIMGEQNMSVAYGYTPIPAGYTFSKPKRDLGTVQEAIDRIKSIDNYKARPFFDLLSEDNGQSSSNGSYWVEYTTRKSGSVGRVMHYIDERTNAYKMSVDRLQGKGRVYGPDFFSCDDVNDDGKCDVYSTLSKDGRDVVIENSQGKFIINQTPIDPKIQENVELNIFDKRAEIYKVE